MKSTFIVTLLLACIALNSCIVSEEERLFNEFTKFMKKYNKHYSGVDQMRYKFETFKNNFSVLAKVMADKKPTYSVGVTKFFDMTAEEFKAKYLGFKKPASLTKDLRFLSYSKKVHAESFDWRDQGAVSDVKDQGSCGSCWAFSTVANIEGLNFRKTQQMTTFSEQQLVDCDTEQDQGCNGGLMENAFEYIKNAGGLETDSEYPYLGVDSSCQFDQQRASVRVSGFTKLNTEDEDSIASFLTETGPLAVALNADPLMYYSGGIVDAYSCDSTQINHAVTIVGYGSEDGQDYWIVKNSWGSGWGEQGYFRIARGSGACGINTYITSAILE